MDEAARLERRIRAQITEIDRLLSAQVNEIIHHPDFARLEGAWRGLRRLVFGSETDTRLRIRVLTVSKVDLLRDVERAAEFDQSGLYRLVHESELAYGGTPLGVIIGDYEFDHQPHDIALLERISNVAAAALAPFIAAASPEMFDIDSFKRLAGIRDLHKKIDLLDHIRWRAFRESEDARYVALALPRVLARPPYGTAGAPVEEFDFEEAVDGDEKRVWSNPAYEYGACITAAIARHGWCAAIRGLEGGGLVEGLPSFVASSEEGAARRGPLETMISDVHEMQLDRLGFIALVERSSSSAVFLSNASCQKSQRYDDAQASEQALQASKVDSLLCAGRVAHAAALMVFENRGRGWNRQSVQSWLQTWLDGLCCAERAAVDLDEQARQPLIDAEVTVQTRREEPSWYVAMLTMTLGFHFAPPRRIRSRIDLGWLDLA